MEIEINVWAVLLAFLSSMAVGSIWYAKALFGAEWMKLVGLTDKTAKEGMAKAFAPTLFAALLQAYLIAFTTSVASYFYTEATWLTTALITASVLWLVQAAAFVTHDAFEQRPIKLTLINIGNQLATLLVMGLIIGLIEP